MSIDLTARFSGPTCRFAVLGHSFEAFGQERTASGAGFTTLHSPRGSHFWLQALMGPRFDAPYMATGKYGGTTTTNFVSHLSEFIAECRTQRINTVLVIGCCNDGMSTLAAGDVVINNYITIATALANAGIYAIFTTDLPAGSTFLRSASTLRQFGRLQEYVMYNLPRISPFIVAVDIYRKFVQPANTDGTATGFTTLFDSDQLHPNVKGHYTYAKLIYDAINSLFPVSADFSPASLAFDYSVTAGSENKRGNIVANGMLTGAGPVATSWTNASAPSGLTVTPTVGVDADGTPYQQFAITGTPAANGAAHQFRIDPSTGRFNQSDKHRPSGYVLVKKSDATTGYTNLRGIEILGSCSTSSPSASYNSQAGYSQSAGDVWPTDVDWSQFNGGKGLYLRGPDETEITGAWTTETPFARYSCSTVTDNNSTACDIIVQYRQLAWKKTFAATLF